MRNMSLTGPRTLHDLVPCSVTTAKKSLEDKRRLKSTRGESRRCACLPYCVACYLNRALRIEAEGTWIVRVRQIAGFSLRKLPNTPVYWSNNFVPFEEFISLSQGFA